MSEEARKAAHEHWWQEPVYPNTKCRCGLKWSDRDAHADHTAAIREKAMALVERIAEIEEYDHVEYPELVDELTALKAALEGNDEDTDA